MLFDRSVPQHFQAAVLDRRIVVTHSRQRGTNTTYHVVVGPWGRRGGTEDLDEGKGFYDGAEHGRKVCVVTGTGALGLDWYRIRYC